MWDKKYGCTNNYPCASAIYIISCLDLELCIVIYKMVGSPGHDKNVVDGLNARYKQMLKLEMEVILNNELFCCDTNFYKFEKVHEN